MSGKKPVPKKKIPQKEETNLPKTTKRKNICYCKKCGQTIEAKTGKECEEMYSHLNGEDRCYEFGQSVLQACFSDSDLVFYIISPK